MTVRTHGYPTFAQGDFYRTDRGITWGIKCSDFEGTQFVGIFIKQPDGSWGIDESIDNTIDNAFDIEIGSYENVLDWFVKKLLPKLNAWLALMFPALVDNSGNPVVPPTTQLSKLAEADLLINTRLSIIQNPDGTLQAILKT